MKEYLLLIRNEIDHHSGWSAEHANNFLKACEVYIGKLKNDGNLLSAQPLVREGIIISGSKDNWKVKTFQESKEVIVGYYHILAKDMDDATNIARANPEFEYGLTARIEVRPIKMKEEDTGFLYPTKK
jgi:hypothetical protein